LAGELADGFGCLAPEETPPTTLNCSACKGAGREPWLRNRNETPIRKMAMKRAKSSRTRLGTVKRLTCRVEGQIGVCDFLRETRVARLAECRQNRRRVTTSTPALMILMLPAYSLKKAIPQLILV